MTSPAAVQFGPFQLDPARRLLLRRGEPVDLTPKAFDALVLLVERRERVVSKQELLAELWPDTAVEEGTLSQHIFLVRRALSESNDSGVEHIATVPRRGYRFVAAVEEAPGPIPRARSVWRTGVAAAAIIAASSLAAIVVSQRPSPRAEMVVRLSYVLPADQQLWRRGRSSAAISPDGRSIVYTASRQLFLRTMSDSEPRPISGPELDAGMPFFSPDGEWVGFWCARDSTLRKIRTAGGGAVTLASASNPRGASWLGDVIVVAEGGLGIVAVPPAGGPPAVWVLPDQDEVLTRPQLLPGADAVLFTAARVLGNRTVKSDVAVYSRSSGSRRVVITDAVGARYVPGGFIVYAAGGALFAVRFDLRSLRVTGRPIPIADDINRFEPNFDVARDGTLIYVHDDDEPRADTRLAIVDAGGTMQPIDLPPADYDTPRISPDAKRLAVDSGENDGTIWICDLEHASTPRRLTSQGHARSPVWSPDGTRIAYGSTRDGQVGIFVQRADGSGVAERVTAAEAGVEHVPGSWSHDGRLLAYASVKAGIKDTIWTVSMSDDHRTTRVLAVAGSNQMDPSISPDGQWIAYSSEGAAGESRLQVYVQPFPPTGEMVQISRDGGEMPTWSPDGRRLFYRPSESQALRSVSITTRPSFAAARAATFGRGLFVGGYDAVTGRRLVVVLAGEARDTRPAHPADRINVVMHWVDAMKGQTPTAAGVGEIARPHRNGA